METQAEDEDGGGETDGVERVPRFQQDQRVTVMETCAYVSAGSGTFTVDAIKDTATGFRYNLNNVCRLLDNYQNVEEEFLLPAPEEEEDDDEQEEGEGKGDERGDRSSRRSSRRAATEPDGAAIVSTSASST